MAEHGWPGNVRELRNFVDRAGVMFAGRTIGADEAGALLRPPRPGRARSRPARSGPRPSPRARRRPMHVPPSEVVVPIRGRSPSAPAPQMNAGEPVALKEMLAEIERRYIEQALTLSGGVIADAARMLTLQRTTLIEKMRKYEMKAACEAPAPRSRVSRAGRSRPRRCEISWIISRACAIGCGSPSRPPAITSRRASR